MAAFTPPPSAPQRGDRATFSSRVDAFLTWLVQLIPQLNAFVATLSARDLGGANTFVYTFDSTTTDADPGPGRLRLGGTPQDTSSVLRLDGASAGGVNMTSVLTALGAVTSNVKGTIRLQKVNDPTVWMLLDVATVDAPAGYYNAAVTVRSASSVSPFANGDSVAVFIDRNGDKGDSGGTPTSQQIRDAVGTMGIANGGTGATTAVGARANLGAMAASAPVLLIGDNLSAGTKLISGSTGSINAMGADNGATASLTVSNGGVATASSIIRFLRQGAYSAFFGLDTDNKWKVGGDTMGAAAYEIFHRANFDPANYAPLAGANFYGAVSAPNFTTTSDERLKENWRPITDEQLDALADLDLAGLFDWNAESGLEGSSFGGSAQKIREIFPAAVFADAHGRLSVDYSGLCFAITQAQLRRMKQERAL